jgi:hypothetical protein
VLGALLGPHRTEQAKNGEAFFEVDVARLAHHVSRGLIGLSLSLDTCAFVKR